MANKPEIINEIEGLTVHCRPPLMEADSRAGWLRDWCDDLAPFQIEHIRSAIRDWRHSGNTKFPTPGQLLPMIRAKTPPKSLSGETPRPWEPISDHEYDALPMREKIRHQTILAKEARRKAGPMFKNTTAGSGLERASGDHIPAEDMPDTWRRWNAVADGHEAEAARIRKHLRNALMAAE